MNKLKNSTCYLIGSMDACPNGGKLWREEITPFLESLNIKVFNPCSKPVDIGINEETARAEIQKLKDERRFDEIRSKYKAIRSVDLRMCDKADFLIFYLDLDILTVGSWEEAFTSNRAKKPVLFVIKQGDKRLYSNWLFWTFPHEFFFENFDELKHYLNEVNSGEDQRTFNRWYFFNNSQKIYGLFEEGGEYDDCYRNLVCVSKNYKKLEEIAIKHNLSMKNKRKNISHMDIEELKEV